MIKQSTIDKMHDLRLSSMASAFEEQCNNHSFDNLSFEDRVGMLIDRQWDSMKNNTLIKLIKQSGFRYPNACMEDIEYLPDRNLDKSLLYELSTQTSHIKSYLHPLSCNALSTQIYSQAQHFKLF